MAPAPETRATASGNGVRPSWGDRLFLLFCLVCALLLILINTYDLLKGLLGF
jgi:hypothetical protein